MTEWKKERAPLIGSQTSVGKAHVLVCGSHRQEKVIQRTKENLRTKNHPHGLMSDRLTRQKKGRLLSIETNRYKFMMQQKVGVK